MKELPETITIGERVYSLNIWQEPSDDGIFSKWWFVSYERKDESELPPQVHDKKFWYYLQSAEETREAAVADMQERLDNMIIDEETIKQNSK